MQVLAEFEFNAGKNTRIIYEALLPELDQDYQSTKTSIVTKGDTLFFKVEANDTVSMRAALNGWLGIRQAAVGRKRVALLMSQECGCFCQRERICFKRGNRGHHWGG